MLCTQHSGKDPHNLGQLSLSPAEAKTGEEAAALAAFHIETLQEEEGEQREIEEDRDRPADRRRRHHHRVLHPLGHDSPHSLFLTFFLGSVPFYPPATGKR